MLGLAAAVLAGCGIKFSGVLGVHEPITFVQKGQDCDQAFDWWNCKPEKTIVLDPGQFTARATLGPVNNENMIRLEVDNASPATTIELKFDKNIPLGEHFRLNAVQTGQNFDLAGDIATYIHRGPEEGGMESCSYQAQDIICDKAAADKGFTAGVSGEALLNEISLLSPAGTNDLRAPHVPMPGHPEHAGPAHGQLPPNCHTVWATRYGERFVRYYYETTDRDISARFLRGEKNLADYSGHASDTEKVYTFQGECHGR